MEKLIIVKIGGEVIDNPSQMDRFLKDFARISSKKVLVHGGGKIATDIGLRLGIKPNLVDGRRVTDRETLKVITMVYAGLVNKNIVSKLQSFNCNSIGLSGADANIFQAKKREVKETDYGFVGDIEKVNCDPIIHLLQKNIIPIIAPLTHDKKGNLFNTNGDDMAMALAVAMSHSYRTILFYCFSLPGVLQDPKRSDSLIKEISWKKYQNLKKNQKISDGMIPKMETAFFALKSGVKQVYICHSNMLLEIISGKKDIATTLTL
jgi:acetylglutamate kinase